MLEKRKPLSMPDDGDLSVLLAFEIRESSVGEREKRKQSFETNSRAASLFFRPPLPNFTTAMAFVAPQPLQAAALVEEFWAQCEHPHCEKWRKLPPGSFVDESKPWLE